jgi:polyhydroxyalkanoate synthesis repressor PhaR
LASVVETFSPADKPLLSVKKYGNRRLYDLNHKCYITMADLEERIREGYQVTVTDSRTGEDLTQSVLTQLIMENQKNSPDGGLFTSELLHQMIRYRDQSMADFLQVQLPSLLNAYMSWQAQAQNQFLHWAELGWHANRQAHDWWMPPWNAWGNGGPVAILPKTPQGTAVQEPPDGDGLHSNTASEIAALKSRLAELERHLQASPLNP